MRRKLIVLQDGNKECGSACLLSILRFYGGNVPINKIIELTNTTREGTSFFNLKDAAFKLGLLSKAYKIDDFDYLIKLNSPLLCQINIKNYLHFIVVYKIKDDYVEVMDPAVGQVYMVVDEFRKRWTGNVMIFSPNKKLINYSEEKIIHSIIEEVIVNNQKIYLLVVCISFIYTITSCIYTYYMKVSIDKVIYGSVNNLILITFIFLVVIVIKNVANLLRNNLIIFINERMDFSILNKIYQKILLLPYNYFYNHQTGDIISRIMAASNVKQIISKITVTILLDDFILVVGGFILYNISSLLFKVLIVNIIIYLILLFIFRPILKKYTKRIQENSSLLNNFLVETISSFETIKGLSLENIMSNRLEKLSINNIDTVSKYEKVVNIQSFFKDIMYAISLVIIMYLGTKEVINNNLSLSNFITFNAMLVYFMEPVRNIIDLSEDYHYLVRSLKRVNDIFGIKSLNLEIRDNLVINGNIRFNNLYFSFNGYNNVLKNINIVINDNEKVLIMGPSGCGKSTLLKLLMKYYDIKRNTLFINNFDINDFSYMTIKNNISYISQNELIYSDTIRNNICLGRNIEEDRFLNICKICKVDEIIESSFLGYDTNLEENAHNLSGGQRQRIVLARCLVNDSNILLIDEGLNQLDVNLERGILKELFKLDKTIIVVSHRIDNMDLYDKLIKLKEGEVEVILDKKNDIYE